MARTMQTARGAYINPEDIQQVADVLGVNLTDARRLLSDCRSNVEEAIAAGLSSSAATAPVPEPAAGAAAGPSNAQQQQRQNTPETQLLAILSDLSIAQAADLLLRSGQSVEQAANLYFEQGAPALPPNTNGHNNNANNEGEVITIDDSSTSEEEEEEDRAPPPRRGVVLNANRPASWHIRRLAENRAGQRPYQVPVAPPSIVQEEEEDGEEEEEEERSMSISISDDDDDSYGVAERDAGQHQRYTEENPNLDGVKVSSGFKIPSLIDAILKNKLAQADSPPPGLDTVTLPFSEYRKPYQQENNGAGGAGGGGGGKDGVGRLHYDGSPQSLPDKQATKLRFPMVLGRLNFPISSSDLMEKNEKSKIDEINQVMQNFPKCFNSEKKFLRGLVRLQQAKLIDVNLRLKHVEPSLQHEYFVIMADQQQQQRQAAEAGTGKEEEDGDKAGPSNGGKKDKQSAKNIIKPSTAAVKKKNKTPKSTSTPLKDKEQEGKEELPAEMANCIEVEVLLTKDGYTQLSWIGEDGSLPPKEDHRPKQCPFYKKHLTYADKELQPLFLKVLSALLLYGGLQVGPDCDGLLNFCDTSAEEADLLDVDKLNAMPVSEARKMYEVGSILDAIIPEKGALTEYHAPPGLIAHPKHYQLAGLNWMVNRERKGDALNRGLLHLHPNWFQFLTPDNQLLYMHHANEKTAPVGSRGFFYTTVQQIGLSGTFFATPAPGTCGGCLVDEMGLGKTLQMLMLVVTNPPQEEWATTVKRLNTKRKSAATRTGKSLKSIADEEEEDSGAIPIKTTLVVVPSTLLNQWAEEIDKHLHSDALKWCYYKAPPGGGGNDGDAAQLAVDAENESFNKEGNNNIYNTDEEQEEGGGVRKSKRRRIINRPPNISELGGKTEVNNSTAFKSSRQRRDGLSESIMCTAPDGSSVAMDEMDLCLMSYEQLRDELGKLQRGGETSGLHAFGFWRVVLDEAQIISNTNSVAAIMASSLWRRHAWVCTGTPISQKFSEIQGLLEFLSYQPYMEGSTWRELLENPSNAGFAQSRRAVVSAAAANAQGNASGRQQNQQQQEHQMYGLLRTRSLLRTVMLRRSKNSVQDELELPPCLREDLWVDLSPVEKLVYQQCRREFVDTVFNYMRTVGNNNSNNRKKTNVSGKAAGNALSTLTALRQSCCHPQIVGRRVQALGKERLSMKQIMAKMVLTSYNEWDMGVRRLTEAEMIHAGVMLALDKVEEQRHPAEVFARLMMKIRLNAEAALSSDVRSAAMEKRRMDGGLLGWNFTEYALHGIIGGGGGGGGGGGKKEENGVGPRDKGKEKAENGNIRNDSDNGVIRLVHEILVGLKSPDDDDDSDMDQQEGGVANVDVADGELHNNEETTTAEGEAKKEGIARYRFWKRVELSMLELYHHILSNVPIVIPKKKKKMGKTGRKKKRGAMSDDDEEDDEDDDIYAFFDDDAVGGGGGCGGGKTKTKKEKAEEAAERAAEAAVQAERERVLARPGRQKEITEAAAAVDDLRAELGLALGPTDNTTFRRSKRAAGVGVLGEVFLDEKEVQEQIQNSKIIVRTYNQTIHDRQRAGKSADTAVAQTLKDVSEAWHNLQHLLNKQDAFLVAEKGKDAAEDGDGGDAQAGPSGGGAGTVADLEGQEDLTNCPICLDDMLNRSITPCGHHFHPECIRECLAGNAQCPICRKPLKEKDLLDACSEEEAKVHEEAKRAAELINNSNSNQDFGAKVSTLLEQLAIMKSADANSKAVVFSSWSKLLKLVAVGLDGAGVEHATLCGGSTQQRQAALHRFLHDPDCTVLTVLMSTSGGAAGLTLTNAQAAFIMEPSINPGLEQQAAARIYRLGQTKQTRVVRILAKNTVEERLLEVQKKKLQSGSEQLNENIQEVSSDLLGTLYNQLK